MRRVARLFVAGLGAAALVGTVASPVGAGGDITLTIEKVVEGEPAPGTLFVIDLNCDDDPDVGGTQVTFDAEGNAVPAGSNVLQWTSIPSGGAECTPTEQPVPDTTTSYACEAAGFVECSAPGPQASPVVLALNGTGTGVVTVTNTPVLPAPPPTAPPPPPEPAAPVAAAPAFTG